MLQITLNTSSMSTLFKKFFLVCRPFGALLQLLDYQEGVSPLPILFCPFGTFQSRLICPICQICLAEHLRAPSAPMFFTAFLSRTCPLRRTNLLFSPICSIDFVERFHCFCSTIPLILSNDSIDIVPRLWRFPCLRKPLFPLEYGGLHLRRPYSLASGATTNKGRTAYSKTAPCRTNSPSASAS